MFHLLRTGSETTLIEGDGDVAALWHEYRAGIRAALGPEPNMIVYRKHFDYVARRVALLREYQHKYNTGGDFETIFVEWLTRDRGFRKHEYSDVRLV